MHEDNGQNKVIMPKLIIDESILKRIAASFTGQPITMGPDGEMLAPGIVDLLDTDHTISRWVPNDDRTGMLVLAAEACRDVLFYSERLIDSKTRRRAMRGVTVPVCKLMDVTALLISRMNDKTSRDARAQWPNTDQKTYHEVAKHLKKKRLQGPVRWVRNKIAAHLDAEAFTAGTDYLKLDDILGAFGDCVILLTLSMNYPSSWFSWIRALGTSPDGQQHIVETMFEYPICVRWITDLDGHPIALSKVILAEDPRHGLQAQMSEALNAYNELVRVTGTQLPLITMKQMIDAAGSGQNNSTTNIFLEGIKIFQSAKG
ncbi:hypothetical protein JW897_06885 [Chromobacterium alkanivorans]|uniref:hypothetical protein n=1 Tax=Chromobacterium alkanivorans TaxID=1071719 RepID=UPI00196795EB|nr:hypothetical protein [Chromobacterium alkanivorans]MBN3003459.1 hypothetical protein [Chromobacterium alkanivorans]